MVMDDDGYQGTPQRETCSQSRISEVGAGDDETDSLVEDSEDNEMLPGTSLLRVMRR